MRELSAYMDEMGFIGHLQPGFPGGIEFGDGSQRTGMFWIAKYILEPERRSEHAEVLRVQLDAIFRETPGRKGTKNRQYVRHWDARAWPGQLWIMSRDNLIPMLIAAILYSEHNLEVKFHANRMLKLISERKGLVWNYKHIWPEARDEPKLPDVISPWALKAFKIRHSRNWLAWPLLWVYDLDPFVNSIIRIRKGRKDPHDTGDDLNHQVRLVFNQVRMWTPTIWLARQIYGLFRPNSSPKGVPERLPGYGPTTAFLAYFAADRDPPMYLLWGLIIKKYI